MHIAYISVPLEPLPCCYFIPQCKVKVKVAHVSNSLRPHGLYNPWNSPGQNTGVGSHSFLQGIFPNQGSNPGLPYCRWILYQLSHQGNPRILEWITYPFSSRSFQPRNQTGVSCIAGRFFTNWALREAHKGLRHILIILRNYTRPGNNACPHQPLQKT